MVKRVRGPSDEGRVVVNLTNKAIALPDDVRDVTGKIKTACLLTSDRPKPAAISP